MKLADYQRQLLALSFAPNVRDDEVAALGDVARFRLYRHMIRTRFLAMAKVAFRNTMVAVGEPAFDASFARYLAAAPPRTPLIRDVIAAYGAHALTDGELLTAAPPFTRDLVRFEQTKWQLAYVAAEPVRVGESGVRELDFEGAPVLNPTLQVLALSHAVHEYAGGGCREGALTLLVYRPASSDDVRWYPADPLLAAVLGEAGRDRAAGLVELVRRAVAQLGRTLDEALLEELASAITVALQRGVLMGSRDSA